jgi:hypothetical protein
LALWQEIRGQVLDFFEAVTGLDMPTRKHTKRPFSAKNCKNYKKKWVVVQSFSLL